MKNVFSLSLELNKCFDKLKRLSLICCFNNEVKIESKTRRRFIIVRDLKDLRETKTEGNSWSIFPKQIFITAEGAKAY